MAEYDENDGHSAADDKQVTKGKPVDGELEGSAPVKTKKGLTKKGRNYYELFLKWIS